MTSAKSSGSEACTVAAMYMETMIIGSASTTPAVKRRRVGAMVSGDDDVSPGAVRLAAADARASEVVAGDDGSSRRRAGLNSRSKRRSRRRILSQFGERI